MNPSTLPPQSPLVWDDWSGGITDNTVSNDLRRSAALDNLNITDSRKPKTRPGSVILDSAAYRLNTNARVSALVNFRKDTTLLAAGSAKVFRYSAGALTELTGPAGSSAFPSATSTAKVAFSEWKDHLFLTNDAGNKVVTVYQDNSSAWQLRTAGLPVVADTANYVNATVLTAMLTLANDIRTQMLAHYESGLATAIASANDLKSKYNVHRASTAMHTTAADTVHTVTAANASNLATLKTLVGNLVSAFNGHITDARLGAAWAYHIAQSTTVALLPVQTSVPPGVTKTCYQGLIPLQLETPSSLAECEYALVYLKAYYNAHDADTVPHGTGEGANQSTVAATVDHGHLDTDTTSYALITSAAATTFAELVTLVNQLGAAFKGHQTDLKSAVLAFHWGKIPGVVYGEDYAASLSTYVYPAEALTLDTTVTTNTTYPEMVAVLNELKLRFNSHTSGWPTHTTYADEVTADFITGVDSGPYLRLDKSVYYALTASLISNFNTHVSREGVVPNYLHKDRTGAEVTANQVPATFLGLTTTATTERTLSNALYAFIDYALVHADDFPYDFHPSSANNPFYGSTPVLPPFLGDVFGNEYGTRRYGGINPGDWAYALTALKDYVAAYDTHRQDAVAHYPLASNQFDPVGSPNVFELADYLYAFHWKYTYRVGDRTRELVGPVLQKSYPQVLSIETKAATLAGLPTLSNGTGDNYDTTNITLCIYRTTNGGAVFYKVGEIANGTSTFTDAIPDTDLTNGETLYTTGDLPEHDPPPVSKYLHIVGDTSYFLSIVDGDSGETLTTRLRQGIPGIVEACPGDFFVDLDDPGMGISSAKGRVMAFSNKAVYRIDGRFDETGAGALVTDRIYDADGLVAHTSLVQIEGGLLFAGNYGFYFTDGYQVTKLSGEFNTTYAALFNKDKICGAYDKVNQTVSWAVQRASGSSDNDALFVLHLRFGLSSDGCFTTWSGDTSFAPSALVFFNDQLIRGDRRGYLFKHVATTKTDPVVDTSVVATAWQTQTIVWDWKSVYTNCGVEDFRKYGTKTVFKGYHETNVSVQIQSHTDLEKSVKSLKPIRFHAAITWGDPLILWGTPDLFWDYEEGLIEASRRFPAGALRFSHRQLEITNASVVIWSSDATCLSTVSGGGASKTLTLNDTVTFDWPTDAVGYFVAFDNDSYVREYPITQVGSPSADALTFTDTGAHAPAGSTKWVIRGKPKGEVLHLLSMQMHFIPLSKSYTPFLGGTQGANL